MHRRRFLIDRTERHAVIFFMASAVGKLRRLRQLVMGVRVGPGTTVAYRVVFVFAVATGQHFVCFSLFVFADRFLLLLLIVHVRRMLLLLVIVMMAISDEHRLLLRLISVHLLLVEVVVLLLLLVIVTVDGVFNIYVHGFHKLRMHAEAATAAATARTGRVRVVGEVGAVFVLRSAGYAAAVAVVMVTAVIQHLILLVERYHLRWG